MSEKVEIDASLIRKIKEALDLAAEKEWQAHGLSDDYYQLDDVGFELHLALGGAGIVFTTEPEAQ